MGAPPEAARPFCERKANEPDVLEVQRGAELDDAREHDRGRTQVVRARQQGPRPGGPLVQRVVDVRTQLHRACGRPEIHPLRQTDVQRVGVGEVRAADGLDVQCDRANGLAACKTYLPSLFQPAPDVVVGRRQDAVGQVIRAGYLRLPLPGVVGRVKSLVGIRGAPTGEPNDRSTRTEPHARLAALNRDIQPGGRVPTHRPATPGTAAS